MLDTEYVRRAINDPNADVRIAALSNKNITVEMVKQLTQDELAKVRINALMHPLLPREDRLEMFQDSDLMVRIQAMNFMTPDDLNKASLDKDPVVRKRAVKLQYNPKEEYLQMMFQDAAEIVRQAVVQHPNCTNKLLELAMNDVDPKVRAIAISKGA